MPLVTVPGEVRGPELGDLALALPGGPKVHFGFPPNATVAYGELLFPGTDLPYRAVVLTPDTRLEPGDVWLMTVSQLVGRLVRDGLDDEHSTLNWMAGRLTQALVQAATKAWGFVPFVYTASAETRSIPMARPAHALLTYSGVFGSVGAPVEIWSWGMTFLDVENRGGNLQAIADKAYGLFDVNIKPIMAPSVVLTKTRVAILGDGQHVNQGADGMYEQADNILPVTGTSAVSSVVLPLQTACAVSYYTSRPGVTGRGRSFLPLQAVALPGFLLNQATALEFATKVKAVAQGMESTVGPHLGAHAVISGGSKKNGYTGYTSPVTSYRCGRVPDTMRSRRNALKEQYSIVAAD